MGLDRIHRGMRDPAERMDKEDRASRFLPAADPSRFRDPSPDTDEPLEGFVEAAEGGGRALRREHRRRAGLDGADGPRGGGSCFRPGEVRSEFAVPFARARARDGANRMDGVAARPAALHAFLTTISEWFAASSQPPFARGRAPTAVRTGPAAHRLAWDLWTDETRVGVRGGAVPAASAGSFPLNGRDRSGPVAGERNARTPWPRRRRRPGR